MTVSEDRLFCYMCLSEQQLAQRLLVNSRVMWVSHGNKVFLRQKEPEEQE